MHRPTRGQIQILKRRHSRDRVAYRVQINASARQIDILQLALGRVGRERLKNSLQRLYAYVAIGQVELD